MLAGSAVKNCGVQLLLDSIIKHLPSPLDKGPLKVKYNNKELLRYPKSNEKMCAYAFKVINDSVHGPISFVRTYSGTLTDKSNVYNKRTNRQEKINKVTRLLANELTYIHAISAGDIGAIVGN